MRVEHQAVQVPRRAHVLTKAVVRAAELLGISDLSLARILGVSPASVSRLLHGRTIDPDSKEGELAALFIRVFRSLDAVVGGNQAAARAWLTAHNFHLQGTPAALLERAQGLVHVAEYLDAMRGKN